LTSPLLAGPRGEGGWSPSPFRSRSAPSLPLWRRSRALSSDQGDQWTFFFFSTMRFSWHTETRPERSLTGTLHGPRVGTFRRSRRSSPFPGRRDLFLPLQESFFSLAEDFNVSDLSPLRRRRRTVDGTRSTPLGTFKGMYRAFPLAAWAPPSFSPPATSP